ncbi:MAG TPA: hypothetical protein PKZ76_11490 [Xanthomonadaceae bacterium]|nr:hypothetical protein [Xanthomonadaceae bacterium]
MILRLLMVAAAAMPTVSEPVDASEGWRLGGDLRVSATWSERSDRDATRSDDEVLRARVRVSVQRAFGDSLEARVRLAGRFASDQDRTRLWLSRAAPGRNGAEFGDAVFDEAWLRWRPAGSLWSLQVGRFQTVHALATLTGKGLGQNDSPNLDIHWTDGARLERALGEGSVLRLQLQSMPSGGPGSAHRIPLDFSASGSRLAAFAGIDSRAGWGPFIQRSAGVHWYPRALASDGLSNPTRDDYLTLTARATAAWPLGEGGSRLLLGGEIGHAPNTQRGASGNAWQVELDVEGPERRQSLGLVWGRVPTGWLVSSDFRNNDELGEVRWLWRIHSQFSVDARWRWRRELDVPGAAARARVDRDAYLRATWRY